MLTTMWQLVDDTQDGEEGADPQAQGGVVQERGEHIRKKILAMGKMAKMFRTLREENESVVLLKGLAGGQLPIGVLQKGPDAIRGAITGFQGAKKMDSGNEKRPSYNM